MKRVFGAALCLLLCAAAGAAEEVKDEPTPERVTVVASGGGFFPVGRFGDVAQDGFVLEAGGFYRLRGRLASHLAPAFTAYYGFLEPVRPPSGVLPGTQGAHGSIDTTAFLGGLRVFMLPETYRVQPWFSMLAGWAHYTSFRPLPLAPAFAPGHAKRDDPMVCVGGGVDVKLHPNFSIGFVVRDNISLTDDHEDGERDLSSVSVLGALLFHY
jgi:hypothetical protein